MLELHPTEGAICSVSITKHEADPLDIPTGDNIEWQIGEGDNFLSEKIDETLCCMTAEEGKEICLSSQRGESDLEQSDDSFRHETQYLVKLHLKEFKNQLPPHLLSVNEKFRIASHQKEKGVTLFGAGDIEYAFKRFSKAMKYLILMMPERDIPGELNQEYRQLRCQCYSNIAACQLKFNSYRFVIENCTKALAIDPNHVKCLYRRAEARMLLGNIAEAQEDIKRGLAVSPKSMSFHELKRKLTEKEHTTSD